MEHGPLHATLARARRLGFLGPRPVEEHLAHAAAFARAWTDLGGDPSGPALAADLGSGGGLPALPLACQWPGSRWLLIEARQRRSRFLADAVQELHLDDRVTVRTERAELTGRDRGARGACDLVTARSFGPPPVVAECAAPLLQVGGLLLVSEPPGGDPGRWSLAGLAEVGVESRARIGGPPAFHALVSVAPCPDRYPRRPGIPAKRPLW